MFSNSVAALLARVPIFAGLTPEQIGEIAKRAERVKFRSRHRITEAGVKGDGAYLLVSGSADEMSDPPQELPQGALIGELAMLIEHDFGTTVVARGRVHCLKISRSVLHEHMLSDPVLIAHFTQHIRDRLQRIANGLKRVDHLLAKSEAGAARRSAFAAVRLDAIAPGGNTLRAP